MVPWKTCSWEGTGCLTELPASLPPPPVCPRCKHPAPDAIHIFWTCPQLDSLTHPAVARSQHLATVAPQSPLRCLYTRGLLPLSALPTEPAPRVVNGRIWTATHRPNKQAMWTTLGTWWSATLVRDGSPVRGGMQFCHGNSQASPRPQHQEKHSGCLFTPPSPCSQGRPTRQGLRHPKLPTPPAT